MEMRELPKRSFLTDTDNASEELHGQSRKVFIVKESYAGRTELSEIVADLLYSAYKEQETESGKQQNSKNSN